MTIFFLEELVESFEDDAQLGMMVRGNLDSIRLKLTGMGLREYIKNYVLKRASGLHAKSLRVVDLKVEAIINWLSEREE